MKVSLFLSLILISSLSHGVAFYDRHIDYILINNATGIHFRTTEAMENPDDCPQDNFYKIENNTPYEKEMFSLLLAKKASKEPIAFDISGCTETGRQRVMWVR